MDPKLCIFLEASRSRYSKYHEKMTVQSVIVLVAASLKACNYLRVTLTRLLSDLSGYTLGQKTSKYQVYLVADVSKYQGAYKF